MLFRREDKNADGYISNLRLKILISLSNIGDQFMNMKSSCYSAYAISLKN